MALSFTGVAVEMAYNRKFKYRCLGEHEWGEVREMLGKSDDELKQAVRHIGASEHAIRELDLFIEEDIRTTDWAGYERDDLESWDEE